MRYVPGKFTLLLLLAASVCGSADAQSARRVRYEPTESSLARHQAPDWFRDAKLGIFIHWGIYSVPGYAPRDAREMSGEQTKEAAVMNPYAEWYYNTMRIEGSPTQIFHHNAYGEHHDYFGFARTFNEASKTWQPDAWAELFKQVGARYVVVTAKHHDGFTLWPSAIANPHLDPAVSHSERDLIGDLTRSVRRNGMKMGIYYSGLLDWSFTKGPIDSVEALAAAREQSPEYARYADAHWRELIARYRPDILWNDIGYSPHGDLLRIAADYYNAFPQGVLNDRWSPFKLHDYASIEYSKRDTISPIPWEECRGLGKSFGLNRMEGVEETIKPDALVQRLADIVSKNGNLLLNIGPEPDGSIPAIQLERLNQLGGWLAQNGEAIFATRPWTRAEGMTNDGIPLRFTTKSGVLYAILLRRPLGRELTLLDIPSLVKRATWLGMPSETTASHDGKNLTVSVPANLTGSYAWVIRLQ